MIAVTTFHVVLFDSPFVGIFLSLIVVLLLVKFAAFLYDKIPFI